MLASVLAHQGGWDEALLIAAPMVIVVALLALAKRRLDRAAGRTGSDPLDAGTDGGETAD